MEFCSENFRKLSSYDNKDNILRIIRQHPDVPLINEGVVRGNIREMSSLLEREIDIIREASPN